VSEKTTSSVLIVLLALAMTGWGGSWTSGKVASGIARSETIIFWRFLLTTLSLLPFLLIQSRSFRISVRISGRNFLELILASLLLIAYNIFFLTGVRIGYAGAGGVLVTSLNPVMTFGWTALFSRKRPKPLHALGLVLGFAGGAVILNLWKLRFEQLLDSGNLFFLLAPCAWSLLTVLSHRAQKQVSFMTFSFYVYLLSTVLSFPLALSRGVWPVTEQPLILWFNIAYLAFVATSFGTTVYFLASRRIGAQRASSFTFLIPVSAVMTSWFFLGEVPRLTTILGGALSIGAVYLINRKMEDKP
jgi:drug/metabolite transporter (DMT)-like permease